MEGNQSFVDAHVIPGHTIELPKGSRKVISQYTPRFSKVSSCMVGAKLAVDSIYAHKSSIPLEERPRCLGAALHEALRVLQDNRRVSNPGSTDFVRVPKRERIILLAGGTSTYGPGDKMIELANNADEQTADKGQEGVEIFIRLASVAQGMGV